MEEQVQTEEAEAQEELTGTEEIVEETRGELEAAAPEEGEAPEADPYTANFEFSVKDKKLEFDEWARPFVTNKETEDKFREVFEKAHGLEGVKTHRDTIRTERDEIKDKYDKVDQGLKGLNTYVQNKDFNSFFKTLNIPKEDILRYAIDEFKYQEMTPEQRQDIDAHRGQQARLSELELANQEMVNQNQAMMRQQSEFELNTEMTKPEISQIAQAYDARVGQPGAFRNEVINRGIQYESTQNKTITAAQAVQEIVQLVGGNISQNASVGTNKTQQPASQVVAQQAKKQVMSNVQGSGSGSPYKKQPKSIEDLRKLHATMTADN